MFSRQDLFISHVFTDLRDAWVCSQFKLKKCKGKWSSRLHGRFGRMGAEVSTAPKKLLSREGTVQVGFWFLRMGFCYLVVFIMFFIFISSSTKPHKRKGGNKERWILEAHPLETRAGPRPPLIVVTSEGCELWMPIHSSALQVGQMGDLTQQDEIRIRNTRSFISWTPGCNSSVSTQTEKYQITRH